MLIHHSKNVNIRQFFFLQDPTYLRFKFKPDCDLHEAHVDTASSSSDSDVISTTMAAGSQHGSVHTLPPRVRYTRHTTLIPNKESTTNPSHAKRKVHTPPSPEQSTDSSAGLISHSWSMSVLSCALVYTLRSVMT